MLLSAALAIAFAAAHATPASSSSDPPSSAPASAPPAGGAERGQLDIILDDLFAGTWLDPKDPYWRPRRGKRLELSVLIGGEAAFSAVQASTKLPSLGGMVL
ncbi:MAG TPA: hypothetical protein VGO62_16510, partial [Myxococcota bacterium]